MVYRRPSLLEFSSTDLTLLLECSPQFLDRFDTFDFVIVLTLFFILFLFSVSIESFLILPLRAALTSTSSTCLAVEQSFYL